MGERICSIADCDRIHYARGWCHKHWARWYHHGTTADPQPPAPVDERFWAKVEKTDHCWLWSGAIGGWGYGTFNLGDKKYVRAHRYAYATTVGDIPEGKVLDHICRVRHCVNPDHLRVVSQRENTENHSGATRRSQSGIRGVHWDKSRNQWSARVSHNRKVILSKRFDSRADAEAAVIAARNAACVYNDIDRA